MLEGERYQYNSTVFRIHRTSYHSEIVFAAQVATTFYAEVVDRNIMFLQFAGRAVSATAGMAVVMESG